jgi:hypothetical protein
VREREKVEREKVERERKERERERERENSCKCVLWRKTNIDGVLTPKYPLPG